MGLSRYSLLNIDNLEKKRFSFDSLLAIQNNLYKNVQINSLVISNIRYVISIRYMKVFDFLSFFSVAEAFIAVLTDCAKEEKAGERNKAKRISTEVNELSFSYVRTNLISPTGGNS